MTAPQLALDPYRFPGAEHAESMSRDAAPQARPDRSGRPPVGSPGPRTDRQPSDPYLAPSLKAWDRRRLDLHAALTSVGIPPRPGDMAVIRTLSALDDAVNAALVRWITAGH
ncbi:hypothetical protein [Streptomyces sp. NRRL F-4474]|uniref:hypothetical protein n=1 Tax=Streptomyces sp. NRRL F-4474 TaxID=1463851 RepID=UPI00131EB4A6|nr:hypothetical protein [Streptomyces sp. NRRL F-4474]